MKSFHRALWISVFAFLSLVVLSYGENLSWDCPRCGRRDNPGNYCGSCDYSAPWIEMTQMSSSAQSSESRQMEDSSVVEIGDIVRFGHYEQDGNELNGAEPIDWYVLDVDSQSVLLISMYSLDAKPYHSSDMAVNWETCSLRLWMNEEFYNTAFSAEEKDHIVNSQVLPAKDVHKEEILDQGEETTDKVFLLSRDEWYGEYRSILWNEEYDDRVFEMGMIPMCAPATAKTEKNAGEPLGEAWWLRGEVYDETDVYSYSGMSVGSGYAPVQSPLTYKLGIRPLIRVDSIDCVSCDGVSLYTSEFQYSVLSDETIRIDRYLGSADSVVIPDEIDGKKVTSIGINAFLNQVNLRSVSIPNSVDFINSYAFKGCKNLLNITIPTNVISIRNYTFCGCTMLNDVIIPNGVTAIGYCAFNDCSNLTNMFIPDSVTSIDTYAFENCPKLVMIVIPGSYAEEYCIENGIGYNNKRIVSIVSLCIWRAHENGGHIYLEEAYG